MNDCNTCRHKYSRCYCPPGMTCKAYEKEIRKVSHTFIFETDDDWVPGQSSCWTECQFSTLIPLGRSCPYITTNHVLGKYSSCPFKNIIK